MELYKVTDIELYTTEMGDGIPEFMLSDQEVYVINRRCLGRWKAKNEDDLLEQIFEFSGFPVENMTYKTFQKNGIKTISYPRYEVTSWDI